ncbi:MAG: ABC transporter substrate-binding protein, partial [Chloroflexota bacterium]
LWLVVSGLMALSLVMAACAPAATPTVPATPTTPATPAAPTAPTTPVREPPQKEAVAPAPDKPKYGGTLTIISGANIQVFGAAAMPRGAGQSGYVLEQILGVDRTKGPAGTGEVDFGEGATAWDNVVGWLAESWKTPDVGVWVLDIRKGVRFALDPNSAASRLVNGREMTAEDVAYSIEYLRDTPTAWVTLAEPTLIKNTTVERTGPWQITVRTPVAPTTGYLWIMGGGGSQYVWPKEFLQKYGTSNAWQDQVGTGPFILSDFVSDSAATYRRNPNYWAVNPVGPGKGDQLPYPDGVKYLIIPDFSTRLAAFRTGKVDWIDGVLREDGESLLKTNPGIKSYQTIISPLQVAMRTDKQNLPYKDKRVRQALMMATDMEGMKRDLYGGKAELLDSPARKLNPTVYTPLEKQPAAVQELYKYNPEKAKQLLKEAGYPQGFKAKMVIQSTSTAGDLAAVIKDMWAKVGVDVELQPRDAGVFSSMFAARSYDDMFLSPYPGGWAALFIRYGLSYFRGPNNYNLSYVNDPPGTDSVIEKAFQEQSKAVMVDWPKADQVTRDVFQYILEQAFLIPTPAPYGYRLWQPWLKNYYGEGSAKFWLQYVWVDQDLKKASGR